MQPWPNLSHSRPELWLKSWKSSILKIKWFMNMEEESLEAVNAVCPQKFSLFRKWWWTATQNTHFHKYQTPETFFTNGSCVCSYYWYGFSYNMIRKKSLEDFTDSTGSLKIGHFHEQRKVLESKRSFAMKLGRCAYHTILNLGFCDT